MIIGVKKLLQLVKEKKLVESLSERELKEKINTLRQQVEQKERELKSIFKEISLYADNGNELKAKRDGLNARVKELSPKRRDGAATEGAVL